MLHPHPTFPPCKKHCLPHPASLPQGTSPGLSLVPSPNSNPARPEGVLGAGLGLTLPWEIALPLVPAGRIHFLGRSCSQLPGGVAISPSDRGSHFQMYVGTSLCLWSTLGKGRGGDEMVTRERGASYGRQSNPSTCAGSRSNRASHRIWPLKQGQLKEVD